MGSSVAERRLRVLFGSQTGTAEDTAYQVSRAARERAFRVEVQSLEDFAATELADEELVVLFVSTTGDGEVPDGMKDFWRFLLRRAHPPALLQRLRFAVFGLGDSSYEKFNWTSKKLHKRLAQLGARAVVERGDGDEQHYLGIQGTLQPWLDQLWAQLDALCPANMGSGSSGPEGGDDEGGLNFTLEMLAESFAAPATEPESLGNHFVRVAENTRITAEDHFQDVRNVSLQYESPADVAEYLAGDALEVYPQNSAEDIAQLFAQLRWDDAVAASRVRVGGTRPRRIPPLTTLRELLTLYLDPFSPPKSLQNFFAVLAPLAADPLEREKLAEYASHGGYEEAFAYALKPRRSKAEVICDFASLQILPRHCVDLFGFMRSRKYSISRVRHESGALDLTIAVVDYKTKLVKRREGRATKFLKTLPVGAHVPLEELRRVPASLRFPVAATSHRLILVAAGTGIAPFRALLHERIGRQPAMLLFGFRFAHKDFLYADEFRRWEAEGSLVLRLAESRRSSERRYYVQDAIRENAAEIADWILQHNTNSNQMPKQVQEAFTATLAASMGPDGAERHIKQMKASGHYMTESWA